MGDLFERQQENLKRLKSAVPDLFDDAVKLPCDNLKTFKFEDCQTCPHKKKCEG